MIQPATDETGSMLLEALLEPRSIAILGAAANSASLGHVAMANLKDKGEFNEMACRCECCKNCGTRCGYHYGYPVAADTTITTIWSPPQRIRRTESTPSAKLLMF